MLQLYHGKFPPNNNNLKYTSHSSSSPKSFAQVCNCYQKYESQPIKYWFSHLAWLKICVHASQFCIRTMWSWNPRLTSCVSSHNFASGQCYHEPWAHFMCKFLTILHQDNVSMNPGLTSCVSSHNFASGQCNHEPWAHFMCKFLTILHQDNVIMNPGLTSCVSCKMCLSVHCTVSSQVDHQK